MLIFHSYVAVYQKVNPIKSHEITIFLWFSYGFPMVFLWASIAPWPGPYAALLRPNLGGPGGGGGASERDRV